MMASHQEFLPRLVLVSASSIACSFRTMFVFAWVMFTPLVQILSLVLLALALYDHIETLFLNTAHACKLIRCVYDPVTVIFVGSTSTLF